MKMLEFGTKIKPTANWISQNICRPLSKSLVVYLIYFLIAEIVISGGGYERSLYLWAVIYLFVIIAETLLSRKDSKTIKTAIFSGLWFSLTVIILDYLVVNLALQGNTLVMFKRWEILTLYAVTLAIPAVRFLINDFKERSRRIDSLLTNQKPTL